nr:hypothetical protein [Mucilaginibacter sp. L294]
MKNKKLLFIPITVFAILSGLNANAQFGNLLQKAKDKAAQKASEAMDKKSSSPSATSTSTETQKSSKAVINSGFDFTAGDSVIFVEDFANVANGSSTKSFKTNGSATVVTVNDESGKWLALADNATYKLTKQLFYPKHFTVEFDVFAVADQVKDIYPVTFGFTKDNSVSEYNSGNGAYVGLQYYNENDININSSYNDKYLNTEFDLNSYLNRKMHVSIDVDNNKMAVYLDKAKLADTQLFLPTSPKNFYISAPMTYKNGSKVLVSNFKIMTFKK